MEENYSLAWAEAEQHLKKIRLQYADIGAAGVAALTLTLNPLLMRFERGERSERLYKEIMECE